jgi:hypothetical protein
MDGWKCGLPRLGNAALCALYLDPSWPRLPSWSCFNFVLYPVNLAFPHNICLRCKLWHVDRTTTCCFSLRPNGYLGLHSFWTNTNGDHLGNHPRSSAISGTYDR